MATPIPPSSEKARSRRRSEFLKVKAGEGSRSDEKVEEREEVEASVVRGVPEAQATGKVESREAVEEGIEAGGKIPVDEEGGRQKTWRGSNELGKDTLSLSP